MKKFLVVVAVLLVCASFAYAQAERGQIFGTVTDASGAVMPGVKVTLTSPALLQPIEATTSSAGSYQFPGIPIGMYAVKFEQAGYSSYLRENIRIDIGFNAQINAQLKIASVEQTIEVTGAAPVIDTQSASQDQQMDQAALTELPVARSFFNEVELSAGVSESAKDVGGAQNLNQPSFISRGASAGQNRYFYDGADISPAQGSNAMWVDFGSVQEMELLSGGGDASVQTSGVAINMVLKSGSDVMHGSFHEFEEGEKFESDNIGNGPLRVALSYGEPNVSSPGNPLIHFRDIGGELGGPIKKGKLWYWLDYGDNGVWVGYDKTYKSTAACAPVAANELAFSYGTVRDCTFDDPTMIKGTVGKLGWSPFHNNTFTFTNEYSVKQVQYNGFTPLTALISTKPQNSACGQHFKWGDIPDQAYRFPGSKTGLLLWNCGWPDLWKFDDQHIINSNWVVDGGFIHFAKRNQFALHPGTYTIQEQQESSTGYVQASGGGATTTYQPMNNVYLTSNYSLPGKLGGNHTIKAGYNWTRFENCCTVYQSDFAEAIYKSGTGPAFSKTYAAELFRGGADDALMHEQSIYVQDTYTRKRLTLNLGFRWDHSGDEDRGSTAVASPFEGMNDINGNPFNWLPAITFAGAKSPVNWNTFSPRFGVVYDLFGKGKTVIKGNYAQYYDQRGSGELASVYNTDGGGTGGGGGQFVEFPWTDTNGDGQVQMNEVNTGPACPTYPCSTTALITSSASYNKLNPTTAISANTVDPNIKDPETRELTGGVSQEIGAGFGISATYIWRRYTRFVFKPLNGISSANYVACTTNPAAPISPCDPGINPITNVANTVSMTNTSATLACPTTAAPLTPTQCVGVTYYVPNVPTPSALTITNQPDYHVTYKGLEIVVRKVMTKSWFLTGNFTIQSTRQFWTASDAYQDPTNIAIENGAQLAPTSSPGGGFPVSIAVNARWNGRMGGQYRLPWWGINVGGNDDFTQGYPYLSTISVTRPNSAGTSAVLIAPPGTQRFKYVQNLAVRVDKTFTWHERFKFVPSLDIYNVLNSNKILGQQPSQNAANANYLDYVLAPRLARIGITASF